LFSIISQAFIILEPFDSILRIHYVPVFLPFKIPKVLLPLKITILNLHLKQKKKFSMLLSSRSAIVVWLFEQGFFQITM
jgi:hypothetical protein